MKAAIAAQLVGSWGYQSGDITAIRLTFNSDGTYELQTSLGYSGARHISDEQGVAQGDNTQITLTPQSKETRDETTGQTQNVDPGSARTYQWSIGPDVTGVTVLSMTDANGTQTYVPSP
ncbi:hypothetical protein ACFY8B_26635 [Streptomyces sp. NPDC012751]|uniref:hypothetical protein n=1 Tax=Streptomyces sp. NPDC012751 TaxID=3364846 RepID=UPI0036B796DF